MLSLITKICNNVEVYRDGFFEELGFINSKNDKTLVFLNDERYIKECIENKKISSVICSKNIFDFIKDIDHLGICIAEDPKLTFYRFHNYLIENTEFYAKKCKSQISSTAKVHSTAYISDYNVIIKDNVVIEPNVTILSNVYIGENSIIRAGSVIGTEGFQFSRNENNILPIQHGGEVIIHKDVEIQANCCICKGIFKDATEIEENTKLDNLVHIAHGVKIGKRCFIAVNAIIAGYTTIGDDVWIGPCASIANMISIGNNASIKIGSVVTKDVEADESVSGNFAIEHNKNLMIQGILSKWIEKGKLFFK